MQVDYRCPNCGNPNRAQLVQGIECLQCPACGWTRPYKQSAGETDKLARCVVCGCGDLWRQKDFPQRLGLLIVTSGIVLSTVAWAYHQPEVAIGLLMAFALVDFLLYTFMKDVLVCYRCRARHHHEDSDAHPGFDHALAERYRQEENRLKNRAKTQ